MASAAGSSKRGPFRAQGAKSAGPAGNSADGALTSGGLANQPGILLGHAAGGEQAVVASEAPFADAPAECGIGQQRRHPVGVAGLVIGGDHQHIGHHAGHVVAVTTGYRAARGLDRTLFMKLATCQWIRDHRHVILCGPTGIGKSWLACALCHKACREDFSVLYHRVPRLFAALDLARVDLLILDNWGPQVMTADHRRDLMEIVEDRYGRGSLLITSQVPVDRWHEIIGDPTLADAILDRIVHAAYRIDLDGETLRKPERGQELT